MLSNFCRLPRRRKPSRRAAQNQAGLRPFKIVKFFSFTSLVVILLSTLFLSWVISNHARRIMLHQSEAYSLLLAGNLNQQVFRGFVLPTVVRYGEIALSNKEQFSALDRIVKTATHGLKTETVTIYDSRVNVISYSTDPLLIGRMGEGGIEYEKALQGEPNSHLTLSGGFWNLLPGGDGVECRLRTYTPFRQVGSTGAADQLIMGVIEISQDLSEDYAAIIDLQGRIIMASSVVMAVLFLVLRTIVVRGDAIMEERHQERVRLEEKLNHAERLAHLGTMVATVSHEIKSPLGVVRSTAEILEKRIQKVAPGNEHLARIIVDETNRLNNIVLEFLDFARPLDASLHPGDLNKIVGRGVNFLGPQIAEKNIQLDLQLSDDLDLLFLDEEMLYRALLNIMINGIQAMEDGGVLHVQTLVQTDTGNAVVVIGDTGKGMSQEQIEQIFKPFYTDKNRGTGLGLAIAHNIIDHHNGTIEVNSQEGKGSQFSIILPG
ncbi:MAG: two-component sensor histidine kinase [Desulfobulbaceae bacterium]|uniref:histidine kinase n=1 Tax=Candidatus Desulfatifera sulfidica TaxID=2841691 RepID=A0A8J6NA11_9BACT|nr:two-component sensor histidine kinase [Candidatus Desulfatifera sulfidica]